MPRIASLLCVFVLALAACAPSPPEGDAGLPQLCADAGSSPACPAAPPIIGDECDDAVTCSYCAGDDAGVIPVSCTGVAWEWLFE